MVVYSFVKSFYKLYNFYLQFWWKLENTKIKIISYKELSVNGYTERFIHVHFLFVPLRYLKKWILTILSLSESVNKLVPYSSNIKKELWLSVNDNWKFTPCNMFWKIKNNFISVHNWCDNILLIFYRQTSPSLNLEFCETKNDQT